MMGEDKEENTMEGKKIMKTVTFSYDDGVTQDQRLIDLFDKYGVKCTFNLNSGKAESGGPMTRNNVTVAHVKPRLDEIPRIYRGHEVAVHTLTHPSLTTLPDEEVIREVEEDRKILSDIVGEEVVGMAYPNGAVDARVVRLIRENTGVLYSRTTVSTHDFQPQTELLTFHPTVHHTEWETMFDLARQFVEMQPESQQLFYIWGHAYEFDIDDSWDRFEEFLKLISGRDDIRYCTNREAFGL